MQHDHSGPHGNTAAIPTDRPARRLRSPAEEVRIARLRLCSTSVPQAQAVALVNGTVLTVLMAPVTSTAVLESWTVALVAVVALRLTTWLAFGRSTDLDRDAARLETATLYGAVCGGALWGSAGWALFAPASISHQTFLAFAVCGMAAGAVTTLSPHRTAALSFIVLALCPLAMRFALAEHAFAAPMSFMVGLFAVMMLIAATRFHANFLTMLLESLRRETVERELAQIAYFDPLTDLPNRRLYVDHLERASAASRRQSMQFAVCCLDLDNFKGLNDLYGHDVGDDILRHVAAVLKASVRTDDVIARWSGDEFAVLLTGFKTPDACRPALERLASALAAPFAIDGKEVILSASIGATVAPRASDDADTLLREASHAMYLAKRAGRNGFHIFNPVQDGAYRHHDEARQSLRDALTRDELELYVQPKVEMDSGRVYGAEALLRWRHPERGLLAPGVFLPLWEADASMAELDRWVLRRSFEQVERWLDVGLDLVLSVNVSAWLLHDTAFTAYLDSLFSTCPRARGRIELEVTETRALDDIGHISDVMRACAALDVEFALDDFGTGFSSLVHLQRLPVRVLKIDTSFVRGMLDNDNDRNLVRGIVGLGDALGKEVVAEGVETVAHGRALLELGCRHAQGYGIAKPMPGDELSTWIANYVAPPTWCAAPSSRRKGVGRVSAA